jgi:hypothetical protein
VRFAALVTVAVMSALGALPPADAHAQHRVAWGAFTPGAPESRSAIDAFNSKVGRRAEIWHTYKSFNQEPFPYDTVGRSHEAGAVPLITWEPFGRTLRGIARGDQDGYLRSSARQAVAFGKPILLRFAHEMNGDWYPWGLGVNGNTAGDYVSAWRHVARVFRDENASNVKLVWAPNTGTFGSLWPGDDYVDYLGLDGYNWGAKYNSWESFEQVFDGSYRAITRLSRKPLLITEFGANQNGGDKPAWVRHALSRAVAERYPQIRALIYFDNNQDGADWRVSSSGASESAFRAALNDSVFDLDAGGLLGLAGGLPTPPPDPTPAPDPPADPPAGGRMRCGIYPRSTLRMSRMWTINVPIRCNRASSDGCYGLVKVKHVGTRRTLGTAEVELWAGRRNPVRIGLPGWARTALVSRTRVATRVTMRVGSGCAGAAARRVTIRR